METILQTLYDTPIWVWLVLLFLIYRGFRATKQRVTSLPKLFIIPVILLIIRREFFLHATFNMWVVYIFSLAVFTLLGFVMAHRQIIQVDKNKIIIPGTYSTLIILILLFIQKYIFGYLQAVQPALYQQFFILNIIGSGMFTGYLLGRAFNYLYQYLKTKPKP